MATNQIVTGNNGTVDTDISGHNWRPVIAKYTGLQSSINADKWIKLFEAVTRKDDEQKRNFTLMQYVTKEALNRYADGVAEHVDFQRWETVKTAFLACFGRPILCDVVEASARGLKDNETVTNY